VFFSLQKQYKVSNVLLFNRLSTIGTQTTSKQMTLEKLHLMKCSVTVGFNYSRKCPSQSLEKSVLVRRMHFVSRAGQALETDFAPYIEQLHMRLAENGADMRRNA